MPTWITLKNGVHLDLDLLSKEEQIKYFGSEDNYQTAKAHAKMNEYIRTAAKPKVASEKDISIDGSFKTVINGDIFRGILTLGDNITHVKTIAGLGTKTELRAESRLNKNYKQNGNWKKQAGQANIKMKLNGKISKQKCDVHWYYHKNVGLKEMKIKSIIRRKK